MGVVHISHERNRAAMHLDAGEFQQMISALQSAVTKLGDSPLQLAKIWKLADDLSSKQPKPINVVTPSAAALKQRLGVELGPSPPPPGGLQPTPPPSWIGASNAAPLPLASRGFGKSLEDAFASGIRARNLQGASPESAGVEPESMPLAASGARATQSEPVKQQGARGFPSEKLAETETRFQQQGVRRIPVETSLWKGCFQTHAAEHNRDKITSIIYSSLLEPFSGEWEQQGWLISASSQLLNLWICNRKPAGQPLELMHSQPTTSTVDAIDINSAAKVLINLGSSDAQGFRVSLYSLSTETFFKHQGVIQIPDRLSPIHRAQLFGCSPKLVHVSSLQPLKGPLMSALAVGIGVEVLVYEESSAAVPRPGENPSPVSPRACWKAHESPISSMHTSRYSCNLVTGACDGAVRLWDLRNKPSSPSLEFGHQKQVTGLSMLDANTLVSGGEGSSIRVWDLRGGSAAAPLWSMIPDSRPVVNLATSGPGLLAATTRLGLYCVEFSVPDFSSSSVSPLKPLPHGGPGAMLQWNSLSQQLYSAGNFGAISVFGKSLENENRV